VILNQGRPVECGKCGVLHFGGMQWLACRAISASAGLHFYNHLEFLLSFSACPSTTVRKSVLSFQKYSWKKRKIDPSSAFPQQTLEWTINSQQLGFCF